MISGFVLDLRERRLAIVRDDDLVALGPEDLHEQPTTDRIVIDDEKLVPHP